MPAASSGGRGTGPEEIGAATPAKTTRGLPRGPDARPSARKPPGRRTRPVRSHACPTTTRCSTISTRISAPRSPSRTYLARDPRPGRVGQDPRPHPAHRRSGSVKGTAEGRHVLAVTFTRRAAGELVERLDALGVDTAVTSGTFHSLALAQLRGRAADRRQEPPGVLDRKGRVLGPLLQRKCAGRPSRSRDRPTSRREIEWAKARMIPPDRYAVGALRGGAPACPVRFPRARRPLREVRGREAQTPLARLRRPARLLRPRHRNRPRFRGRAALAVPASLRRRVPRRDTIAGAPPARVARRPTRPLRRRRRRAGHLRVRRGRRVAARRSSRDTFPVAGPSRSCTTTAPPMRSSRCRKRRSGPRRASNADAPRVRSARPSAGGHRRASTTTRDEAAVIADTCWHEFTMGVPWDRMAILFRTNAQSSLFETALARRGVPFRVTGAARFAARLAVRVCSTACATPSEHAPTRSLRRSPGRPRGRRRHRARPATLQHRAPQRPRDTVTSRIRRRSTNDELQTHRDALLELGREYACAESGDRGLVAGFISWLDFATRPHRPACRSTASTS